MSRWGISNPPRDPFLYVLDPSTEGEEFAPEETDNLVQDVARKHIEQTALGLGLIRVIDEQNVVVPRRRTRMASDQEDRHFVGAIMTPFGLLDMDFDKAYELSMLLPNPDLVRFVGLDETIFADYLKGNILVPRNRHQIDGRLLVGPDGLLVAPVQEIMKIGDTSM